MMFVEELATNHTIHHFLMEGKAMELQVDGLEHNPHPDEKAIDQALRLLQRGDSEFPDPLPGFSAGQPVHPIGL